MLTTLLALPTQHQRHLFWSVYGPALLDCAWSPKSPEWLSYKAANPAWLGALPDVEQKRTRIGFHFEQVWQQFLSLQYPRVLANLAIRDETRTLGEIDLLLDDGQIQWHIELALKFYLGTSIDWFGPDSRDSFARKLAHFKNHQLTLIENPYAQKTMQEHHWNPTVSQAVMRGCLFYPAHPTELAPLPLEVAENHWRGKWCYIKDAQHYLSEGTWAFLPKPL